MTCVSRGAARGVNIVREHREGQDIQIML